jgi:hypothetical protein
MWAEPPTDSLMPIKGGQPEFDMQFDRAAANFPWPQFCEKLRL